MSQPSPAVSLDSSPSTSILASSSVTSQLTQTTSQTSVADMSLKTGASTAADSHQGSRARHSHGGRLESFGFTASARVPRPVSDSILLNNRIRPQSRPVSRESGTWLDDTSEDESRLRGSKDTTSNDRLISLSEDVVSKDDRGRKNVPVSKPNGLPADSHDRVLSGETLVEGADDTEQQTTKKSEAILDDDESVLSDVPSDEINVRSNDLKKKSKVNAVRRVIQAVATKASSLGKRGRDVFERGTEKVQANMDQRRKSSRLVELELEQEAEDEVHESPAKKTKINHTGASTKLAAAEPTKRMAKPKKSWLNHGLYVGQDRHFNARLSGAQNRAKKDTEIGSAVPQENKSLPLPMYFGEDLLRVGRDFKLPFDIFNPLSAKQPKPDEWKKTQSNRIVGNATAVVKEWSKFRKLPSSKCLCTEDAGCDENCLNRMMLYECDDSNCALGTDKCTNRAFAELRERCKTSRKYDVGVEVMKTDHKGFGIRACRTFEPHQIIIEYAGEIIDQNECNRRIQEDYSKDNTTYYLMEFDNNMIIDATRGTAARFVNHSCEPNCEMVKWTVAGKPRMALFAGESGVMTGEELCYDYNFEYALCREPTNASNFNKEQTTPCHCGANLCRGYLGRKPTEQEAKKLKLVAAAKAKLATMFSSSDSKSSQRKRRIGWVYVDKNGQEVDVGAEATAKAAKRTKTLAKEVAPSKQNRLQKGNAASVAKVGKVARAGGQA